MTAPLHPALRARLHAVLRSNFALHPQHSLAPSTAFASDIAAGGLGADSLDRVQLATLIEQEFEIGFDDDAIADAQTVGDLEDWLADNLRHCSTCGCTENRACLTQGHPCGWASAATCTACS